MKRLVILIAGFIIVPAALATQFDQVWVNAYNGQYDPCDEGGRCVTVAADGYIYACGQGLGALSIYDDFITMKLNPGTGETLWVQYYDGPGRRRDSALAIAVDNSGGVYVTGRSWGSGYDYATVKYNAADGRQCWVARYNAGGTLNDFATAIAVDNSGGVYVTGFSAGSGFTGDYVTIKYDAADGSQCWLARYDGAGDDDFATAIAVDNAGGVYVTGYSYASSSYYDYATVKYSAADGSESWVARYGYSAPDRAYAIAVDNSGGVYVTGYTFSYDHINDYATVKYNASDGSPAWLGNPGIDDRGAARYNGPGNSADVAYAIAVDNAGGVYVTGQSSGSGAGFDYATVKYSAADGSQGWVARYNGPGNSNDYANGIAVDNAGGVYVTGYSRGPDGYDDYATVKYNTSDGSESWVERYNGSGNNADRAYSVAAGNSGGVYVTGFAGSANTTKDFVTVKYAASDGGQAWAACWNLTKSNESGQKVVCDADGYVYTCGHGSSPLDGYGDFITIKYDPATGETLWLRYYDSPDYHSDDQATAIAVDNSGGVYVTGYNFVNGGVVYDYVTVKYDAAGNQQWVAIYNGPGNYVDAAQAIAVDNSGGVYVTGSSAGLDKRPDYATVKYDASTGNQLWLARYVGPAGDYDRPYDIAVDNSGGVYVTGYSVGSGTGPDYLTVRYSATDGSESWVARYNGPANYDDYPQAMAVDNSGGVYVTGYSYDDATGFDCLTVKYNAADGSQAWLSRYDGPLSEHDYAYDIAADNSGGVYVTGYGYGPDWYDDYVTIKYNTADGSQAWLSRYNGPAGEHDCAQALALDAAGVYVTGYSRGSVTGYDCATVWYDRADGAELGSARQESWCDEFAYSVATGPAGAVYVTGYCRNITDDILTIKYRAVVSYPNPWGGSTLAQGYWKNHPYYDPKHPDAPYIEKYLPVTVAGVTVNTVSEALAVIDPPRPITVWKRFLLHFLAARLNAGWQTDHGLAAACYNYPGGDYPFDNRRVSAIFQVADGYRPTTDGALLTEMATVLYNINNYTVGQNRCLWDGPFPPGSGPQEGKSSALTPKPELSVAPSLVKNGIVRVAYSLPKAGPAQLKVLDITGRIVMTRDLPTAAGRNAIALNAGSWCAGVYFLKLKSETCTLTRKVIVE